jgi:hypothetical protein
LEKTIQKRKLGNSNLEVCALGLGCMGIRPGRMESIPVLGNFSVFNTVKIIDARGRGREG